MRGVIVDKYGMNRAGHNRSYEFRQYHVWVVVTLVWIILMAGGTPGAEEEKAVSSSPSLFEMGMWCPRVPVFNCA